MSLRCEIPGCRILVVEDDDRVLELVTTRLELAGYVVSFARDGGQALERITDILPNGMVLDLNMPHVDGFEVLRTLNARGIIGQIPTMVLTARNAPDDVRKAIALGARDFLTKPFKDEQFLSRVGRLIRRQVRPTLYQTG